MRDEGPPWLPLAVGNAWQLIHVVGPDNVSGAVQRAFDQDEARGETETVRVASEKFDRGRHSFELVFEGAHDRHVTLQRRDGEIARDDGGVVQQNDFPVLGVCKFASKPIDAARTLAGPTICDAGTHTHFFGGRYEEGWVLVRSGVGTR